MASKPPGFDMPDGDYAGDVTAREAWDTLTANPDAVLVDVRTQVEWQLIGKPDLASIDREPIYLQWVTMQGINQDFVAELQAALDERGVGEGFAGVLHVPVGRALEDGGHAAGGTRLHGQLQYRRGFRRRSRRAPASQQRQRLEGRGVALDAVLIDRPERCAPGFGS